jgi:hypothetical protein
MTDWALLMCGSSEMYLQLHRIHDRPRIYPFICIAQKKQVQQAPLQIQNKRLFRKVQRKLIKAY